MIEAATLGVVAGWEDGGAISGLRELDAMVQRTTGTASSEMQTMSRDAGQALQTMARDAGRSGGAASGLRELEQEAKSSGGKTAGAMETMEKRARASLDGVKKALGALGIAFGAAVIVGKIKGLTGAAIAAGSAAEEMLGKYNVVFGQFRDRVTRELGAFGEAVGRSRVELQQMASGVQDTFVPLGFARERAADLSVSLTTLATDVASFNNAADSDVMNNFTSALVGNHEAVRQYGIIITEATLDQELMRMGIEGGIRAADEQEKVMARLNLIYAGTTDAQGDAARTAGSWANTQRSLNAILADTAATVGGNMTQALKPLLQDLRDLAREIAPEVARQARMIADSMIAMQQVMAQVDVGGTTQQFRELMDALDIDFWSEVFGTIGKQIQLTVVNFEELGFAAGLLRGYLADLVSLLQGEMSFEERGQRIEEMIDTYRAGSAAFQETYAAINDTDWTDAIQAQAALNQQTEVAAQRWQAQAEAAQTAATVISDAVTPAAQTMAAVWDETWTQIAQINEAGAANSRVRVLGTFSELAEAYAGHAQAIVQIEQERDQYLLYLDAAYQSQAAALQVSGAQADLQTLATAHQAKYSAALGYYNGRIKLEQAGQQAVYATARQYYMITLRTLITQLQSQVRTVVASMRAMAQATVGGYASMAAAAMAFNRARAGAQSIADLTAAISEVQAAMAGIEAAGVAAADQAGSAFEAWQASVGDVAVGVGDVAAGLAEMTRPGGAGSQVRPQIVDPLQEAAKTVQTLATMVDRAIEAFDALAAYGAPATGWREALTVMLDGLVMMVTSWGEAVAELHAAGLIEQATEMQTAAKLVSDMASAWTRAMELMEGMITPTLRVGAVAAVRQGIVALVRELAAANAALEIELGGNEGMMQLQAAAERISAALAPWRAAADAVTAVAGASGTRIEAGSEQLIRMTAGLVRWVDWLVDYLPADVLRGAGLRAEQVTKALAPWRAAADAVTAVAGASGTRIEAGSERLIWMAVGLVRWVDWLERWLGADVLAEAAARAGDLVRALAPWKAAADAVQALNAVIGARVLTHEDPAMRLMWLVSRLVDWVHWTVNSLPVGELEEAAARADDLVRALAPWRAAADAVQALNRTAGAAGADSRGAQLMQQIGALISVLVTTARQIGLTDLEFAARVGGMIDDALEPWDKAIHIADELRMWRILPDLQARMVQFALMWVAIVGEIGEAAQMLSQQGMAATGDFGSALEELMGGLEAALGIVDDFAFAPPDPAQWQGFFDWVTSSFTTFYDWVNQTVSSEPGITVPRFGDAGLAAMNAWAGALGTLMEALQGALSVARDFEFSEPDPAQWQGFFDWVTSSFTTFYDWVNQTVNNEQGIDVPLFGDAGLAAMNAWAGALGTLMDALQGALSVARDFEFSEPDPAQWQGFFDWVTSAFEQFANEIGTHYETEEDLPPMNAWAGALGALMDALQGALSVARGFEFSEPDPAEWENFFDWTTTVFEAFRAEIERRYPEDDPEQFAPVIAWSGAFSSLMQGLQSAISLASDFDFTPPDPADWDEFFVWTLAVLESFRDAIINRYPDSTAATWEPVTAWAGALGALMQALETAATLADGFVFIAPSAVGWDSFFAWSWAVFTEFQTRIEDEFPGSPEEAAATFEPVTAFSNALSAIFGALQNSLSFFMQLDGAGAEFWQFLGGATGDPDTSPFAQRMGSIIGAITGTMRAFDAWVVRDAPQWDAHALTLLTRVQGVIDVLQDALDLFDVAQGVTFPATGEIQQFVQAVLQLFVSFSNGLAGLMTGPSGLASSVGGIGALATGFVTTMQPVIPTWYSTGEGLTGALASGLSAGMGMPTTPNTVRGIIQEVQNSVVSFATWWVPNVGEGFWYDAGDDLVDAFIAGMQSNVQSVYNAAFAVGEAAGDGLNAGAGLTSGASGNAPEGMGRMYAAQFGGLAGGSASATRRIEVTVTITGDGAARMDRRALEQLKADLVYEIGRGA